MEYCFLLQDIHFYNFMLHHDTLFDFSRHPITLFTGANGSGKTQILDGLLLVLGQNPKRIKRGNFSDLISVANSYAEITTTIFVAQPWKNSYRFPEEIAAQITPQSPQCWKVSAKITPTAILHYFTIGENRFQTTRKIVRDFFSALNVQSDNKLAFTEEGTVNIFTDHTEKNKLELFLETTGLNEYHNHLLEANTAIEKASRALEPLKRKLAIEREYLDGMEKTLQLLKQKQTLQGQLKDLQLEEKWARAKQYQDICEAITLQQQQKRQLHRELQKQQRTIQGRLQEFSQKISVAQQQQQTLQNEVENLRQQRQLLLGKQQTYQDLIIDNEKNYQEIAQNLERTSDDAEARKHLERQCTELEEKITTTKALFDKLGSLFFSQELTPQRHLLWQCLILRQELHRQGVTGAGPVFLELQASRAIWGKLVDLFGFFLFSFVVSEQQFSQVTQIVLEKFPEIPEFLVVVASEEYLSAKHQDFATSDQIFSWLASICGGNIPDSFALDRVFAHKAMGKYPQAKILDSCFAFTSEELLKALEDEKQVVSYQQELECLQKDLAISVQKQQQKFYDTQKVHELRQQIASWRQQLSPLQESIVQLESLTQDKNRVLENLSPELKKNFQNQEKLSEQVKQITHESLSLAKDIEHLQTLYQEKHQEYEMARSNALQCGERPESIRELTTVTEKRLYLEGQLATLEVSPVSQELYQAQRQKVERLQNEINGSNLHIENMQKDMELRFTSWYEEVATQLSGISDTMNYLLSSIHSEARIRVHDIKNLSQAGLSIEVKRRGQKWLDLSFLSGGEKVLTVEALILALHLQTPSPLHAIDECTQRLDFQFKALALEMVQKAVEKVLHNEDKYTPQFLLLAPDTIGIEFDSQAQRYFKRIVLAPAVTE